MDKTEETAEGRTEDSAASKEKAEVSDAVDVRDTADTDAGKAVAAEAADGKEKSPKREPLFREDSLEIAMLSRKERRKYRKKKLRETLSLMTPGEKFKYLVYYYKWPVIITLAVLLIAALAGRTLYMNSRPVALSYAIVNADSETLQVDFVEDYLQSFHLEKGYQVHANTGFRTATETDAGYDDDDYVQFSLLCRDQYYDVILTDKAGMEFLSGGGLLVEPGQVLSSSQLSPLTDRLVKSAGSDNVRRYAGIDISDTALARLLHTGYSQVYLCFPGTSDQNKENAARFTQWIFQ